MALGSEDDLDIIDSHAGAIGEADVIVLFGTRHWTPAELAADLFLGGHAALIVTTGGSERHPRQLSEAVVHRDLLLAAGVPPEAVVAETESLSTSDNVRFALPLVEQRIGSPRSVIAVVKWYHRRALVTLARHALSVERIYAADYEPFNAERRIALSRSNWRDSCPRSVERERNYMNGLVASGVDVLARTHEGWIRTREAAQSLVQPIDGCA
ncbi:MAG TPA: YdcF family protein [Acidimicrobiales bacterium]|nr:YdcF family protein [Acidimicrobiales bacterium]